MKRTNQSPINRLGHLKKIFEGVIKDRQSAKLNCLILFYTFHPRDFHLSLSRRVKTFSHRDKFQAKRKPFQKLCQYNELNMGKVIPELPVSPVFLFVKVCALISADWEVKN